MTPQNEPLHGRDMKENNAGGFVFSVGPFERLVRFLILGSDTPTYYQNAKTLTSENSAVIQECLKLDGKKTIDTIVEISVSGRAPKNDPALFALAIAASPQFSSLEVAHYATSQLHKVARTGTHLYHFAQFIGARDANKHHVMRGFGRNLKSTLANWFLEKSETKLAYQLAKYQSRDGWSSKDLIALGHPKTKDPRKAALLAWASSGGLDGLQNNAQNWNRVVVKKKNQTQYNLTQNEIEKRRARFQKAYEFLTHENGNTIIKAFEAAKKATSVSEIVSLIRNGGLTHEMLPTQFKTSPEVWEALLEKMPMTAMVRNLGVMSKVGLLVPFSEASKLVASRLADSAFVKQSKIHPLQVLLAQGVYSQGHGVRGNSTWTPVPKIVDALEGAFYSAFGNVVPTGKNHYIGLDFSGSMSSNTEIGLSAAQIAGAMSLVIARTEPEYCIFGFSHK